MLLLPECISTAYREVCLLPESSRGYGKCLHEILCLKHTVLYRCFASLILCIIYMCQSTIQKTNACMHSAVGTIACISTFIVICPAIFHSLKRIMVQEKVAQPFREIFSECVLNVNLSLRALNTHINISNTSTQLAVAWDWFVSLSFISRTTLITLFDVIVLSIVRTK